MSRRTAPTQVESRAKGVSAPGLKIAVALLGAAIFGAAGGLIGARNAGWLDVGVGSNGWMPVLGIGAALVVMAFASSNLNRRLGEAGGAGRAAKILLVLGPALYVVSWLIEFAIVGTFSLGLGLVCLSVAVTRFKLVPVADRALIILSAVGSLTWNTETVSAFFLVGVGLVWMVLSIRLLIRAPLSALPSRTAGT